APPTLAVTSRSLLRPALSEKSQSVVVLRFMFVPWKTHGVPERCAFHNFARPLVVTWNFHSHRKVRAAIHKELRHRQAAIEELRDGVENWRLSSNAALIHGRARIDVRAAF